MNSQTCKICGFSNNTTWYRAKEMMIGFRDEFRYFQCEQCDTLQIEEFPENIAKYYPQNYYSFSGFTGKKFNGLLGKLKTWTYESFLLKRNSVEQFVAFLFPAPQFDFFRELNISKQSRILEVGCGNGNKFLYPLAEMSFKNILGCDPFIEKTIQYKNGLQIAKKDVFEMTGEWDVIIYDHSFEHVPNPFENLQKVQSLLAPNGICVLRIPTVPCYAWTHYRENWVQLDAPRHYFLHSPKSIKHMADRTGLSLTNVLYDSTHLQFTGSALYLRNITLHSPREKGLLNLILRKFKKATYSRKAKELNRQGQGDQASFILSKI